MTPEDEEKALEDLKLNDILPDTNVDRERTLAGKWAHLILFGVFIFILVAFCTPNWLQGDPRFYGTKVERVGLWVHCLRSLPDFNDITHTRYYAGCRWLFNPFTEGYDNIRSFLAPPFFVTTQFFFTLSFIGTLMAIVLAVLNWLFINEYYRVCVLSWIAIDLVVSAIFGTISLIVFGILADNDDYLPDWEHNYLSWSFGLAFVGVFFQYVSGILFHVESRIMRKKDIAREMLYPMERRV